MKVKNYSSVFFDLDGTLVDNYDAITACISSTVIPLGFKAPTRNEVMGIVGGSILVTLEKIVGRELADQAANSYMAKIDDYVFLGLEIMPCAEDILKSLKNVNVKTACLTNKSQKSAEDILIKLGLDKNLDAIIGTKLKGPRKPDAEFTAAALKLLNAEKSSSLIIGDSPYDYNTAINCDLDSCLVATGGDSLETLKIKCPKALGVYKDMHAISREFFGF